MTTMSTHPVGEEVGFPAAPEEREVELLLVDEAVVEDGEAHLPVQLLQRLHLVHGNCRSEETRSSAQPGGGGRRRRRRRGCGRSVLTGGVGREHGGVLVPLAELLGRRAPHGWKQGRQWWPRHGTMQVQTLWSDPQSSTRQSVHGRREAARIKNPPSRLELEDN
jgi:hypothetical protein